MNSRSRFFDLTGKKFGKLTAIERVKNVNNSSFRWRCKCDCGNEILVYSNNLRQGRTKSCGCIRETINRAPNFIDLTGQKFGKLTVIERADNDKRGESCWRCKCDCGNETIVLSSNLRYGHTTSCRCAMPKEKQMESTFDELFSRYKSGAIKRGHEFLLTKVEFKKLISSNCYYCGKSPLQVLHSHHNRHLAGDITYNGIDRIDNSKGYFKDNVRPCCFLCNLAKGSYSEEEFLSCIMAIYEHLNLKTRVVDVKFESSEIINK